MKILVIIAALAVMVVCLCYSPLVACAAIAVVRTWEVLDDYQHRRGRYRGRPSDSTAGGVGVVALVAGGIYGVTGLTRKEKHE